MAITLFNHFLYPVDDGGLRAYYDHRESWRKPIDLIVSLFRQLHYSFSVLYYQLFCLDPQHGKHEIKCKDKSQGLVVLVHGLRNTPAAWHSQLSLLDRHPIDVFAPFVHERGMCSLEEAAAPLLPILENYTKNNLGKPLCLLGTSNGGRIVAWLETELRRIAPATPVKVSTIAGVHLGSSRMNLLKDLGLAKYFYPSALQEELPYNSGKAQELLNRIKAPLPEGCKRSYEFYATTEDLSIPNLDSSLPKLNRGESVHVVHGHSHSSIVTAVAEKQISSCLGWIHSLY